MRGVPSLIYLGKVANHTVSYKLWEIGYTEDMILLRKLQQLFPDAFRRLIHFRGEGCGPLIGHLLFLLSNVFVP